MPFLGQFDCAELPDPTGLLPKAGLVFVFGVVENYVSWDDENQTFHRVVYVPDVSRDTLERPAPANIARFFYCDDRYTGLGGQRPLDLDGRRSYAPWCLEGVVADSYPWTRQSLEASPAWQGLKERFAKRAAGDLDFARTWTDKAMYDAYHDACEGRDLAEDVVPQDDAEYSSSAKVIWKMPDFNGSIRISRIHALEVAHAVEDAVRAALHDADRELAETSRPKKGLRYLMEFCVIRLGMPLADPRADALRVRRSALMRELELVEAESAAIHAAVGPFLDSASLMRFGAWLKAYDRRLWEAGKSQSPIVRECAADSYARGSEQYLRRCAGDPMLRRELQDGEATLAACFPGQEDHQIMGEFRSCQDYEPLDDDLIPFINLKWDRAPGFSIGECGEMHIFIKRDNLIKRDFSTTCVQIQGA